MNLLRLKDIIDGLVLAGYGEDEIIAYDGDSGQCEAVSGILYSGDKGTIELQTDCDEEDTS